MKALLLVSLTIMVLAVAAPAFAQADNVTVNPDPCQGTMNIDTCMWSDNPMANGGGNYSVCYAYKSNKQTCQSSVTDNITKVRSCQGVTYNAYCSCENLVVSGTCNYQ
jgi:nucleosome binding factor SPN SPT16 subunit